jgi:hypothetical protein
MVSDCPSVSVSLAEFRQPCRTPDRRDTLVAVNLFTGRTRARYNSYCNKRKAPGIAEG